MKFPKNPHTEHHQGKAISVGEVRIGDSIECFKIDEENGEAVLTLRGVIVHGLEYDEKDGWFGLEVRLDNRDEVHLVGPYEIGLSPTRSGEWAPAFVLEQTIEVAA